MRARAALTLGLAFHELTTHAVKYGALAYPGMRLAIGWERTDGALVIRWEESGGRDLKPAAENGFGMTMLRRSLTQQLSAKVDTTFTEGGFQCLIRIPVKEVLASGQRELDQN